MAKSTSAILVDLIRPFSRVAGVFGLALVAVSVWRFPYQTDPEMPRRPTDTSDSFYKAVYAAPVAEDPSLAGDENNDYARIARLAAKDQDTDGIVKRFVEKYGLRDKKALEIGAGRGYLQDFVDDYTGLDIAPSARRFFHKKFVQASATAMPFPEGTFDAAWSIWVFEHVPNPEHALIEARRVVKNGGLLLLFPAFECGEWLAGGYQVRPYSDFGWKGKLYKAALPLIQIGDGFSSPVTRLMRSAKRLSESGPSKYHYRLLAPDYKDYWQGDSDALNDLDYFETAMWFESRGDECLNCPAFGERLVTRSAPLIIRVKKPAVTAQR
ncbi:MAG: class I SAM-dependent methyltransferase [Bryobacteraceae bacterium]